MVGIRSIEQSGTRVKITYQNDVVDEINFDQGNKKYTLLSKDKKGAVLEQSSGLYLHQQECVANLKVISIGGEIFQRSNMGGLVGTSPVIDGLLESGACKPMDCRYDLTTKTTTVGGSAINSPSSFHGYGLQAHGYLRKIGLCKKSEMPCSLVNFQGSLYVSYEGVAVGSPIKSWQDLSHSIGAAGEDYGCSFKQVACSLNASEFEAPSLQVGGAVITTEFKHYEGESSSQKDLIRILDSLSYLEKVCKVDCQYRKIEGKTEVTFNGKVTQFSGSGQLPSGVCKEKPGHGASRFESSDKEKSVGTGSDGDQRRNAERTGAGGVK
jgi:hypothetical protein